MTGLRAAATKSVASRGRARKLMACQSIVSTEEFAMRRDRVVMSVCAGLLLGGALLAQAPAPPQASGPGAQAGRAGGPGRGGPPVVSPEIRADGRVTFRIVAPQATSVSVTGDVNGSLVAVPATAAADAPAAPTPGGRAGGSP